MKTKYINIPKDQRRAMRDRARDSLLHWKANFNFNADRATNINASTMVYQFSMHNSLIIKHERKRILTVEFIEQVDKDSCVTLDISTATWTKDLFNQLYNGKAKAN